MGQPSRHDSERQSLFALDTAGTWRRGNTIWTDGSRLDDGSVGAACAWRTPGSEGSRWTGHRFHLGNNKEAFDAEAYAIYQALSIMDRRQETGRRYAIFADSTAAIERVRSGAIGPRQRFAVAAIGVCTRLVSRSNEVVIHWAPAQHGVQGNETADEMAKAAAEGNHPDDAVPDDPRWETSLSHMARVATGDRSRTTTEWRTTVAGGAGGGRNRPAITSLRSAGFGCPRLGGCGRT